MSSAIDEVLDSQDSHPVLVDVGASGQPPAIWQALAPRAIYVGFDADQRDLPAVNRAGFYRALMVTEAVVAAADIAAAHFYLTHSPYCSSTLPPDEPALANYLFADQFKVEGEATVPATTLDAVLARFDLPGIDWLKLDTQGTDLRLFQSLAPAVQARVLALDVEPGLAPAYAGEDDFATTHAALLAAGFWLSNLRIDGAVRLRPDTLAADAGQHLSREMVESSVRRSPVYAEARYLRTVATLAQSAATPREYALLWAFALLDQQPGYALDVAAAYQAAFGSDALGARLWAGPASLIRRPNRLQALTAARRMLYALVPANVRRAAKSRLR